MDAIKKFIRAMGRKLQKNRFRIYISTKLKAIQRKQAKRAIKIQPRFDKQLPFPMLL